MAYERIEGKPVRFPPGHVQIRLSEAHRSAYKALYARYQSILAGLPVLRDRDFDGRAIRVSAARLSALNRAFEQLEAEPTGRRGSAFGAQEARRSELFKKLQYLS
jgi:hypothetical protein